MDQVGYRGNHGEGQRRRSTAALLAAYHHRGDRRELRRERVVGPRRRGSDRCDRGDEGHSRRADDGRAIEVQTHLEIIYALQLQFSFMNYVDVLFATI